VTEKKMISARRSARMKGERIAVLTAYDFFTARLL